MGRATYVAKGNPEVPGPDDARRRAKVTTVVAAGVSAFAALVIAVSAVVDVVRLTATRESSFRASFWHDPEVEPFDLRPLGSVTPGDGGQPVQVADAYLKVGDLPNTVIAAAALETIAGAAAGIVLFALLFFFSRNLMNGTTFSRTNTRIISGAAATVLVGWVLSRAFGNAAAGPALESVGARSSLCLMGCTGDGQAAADYTPLIAFLLFAVLAIVFRTGERLQRDTEGLV